MRVTWWHRLQGRGLGTYAALIRRTARYEVAGQENVDRTHDTGQSSITALWHGMTMMLSGYLASRVDPSQYVLIIPDDHRGAVLSVWGKMLGGTTFPISMHAESMVAARRLLALIGEMKKGKRLVMNPDGPYGPSHEIKPGVLFIARKARAAVIPAGLFTATGYHIPRWDRYTVPFPFSRIALVFGEPLEVGPEDDLGRARLELRERMNQAEQDAKTLYYGQ